MEPNRIILILLGCLLASPAWAVATPVNCADTSGQHLNYATATNAYSCGTSGGAASNITVGTSAITSGTNTRVLYDNSGVVGEYVISGSGNVCMSTSCVMTTPNLGTPSAGVATNLSGTASALNIGGNAATASAIAVGGITGLGTGVATALAVNTGSAGAFVVNGGALGTPSSGTATSLTGLPVSTGITGLGTGVATWLATPSSANLISALTDETGTGPAMFGTSPTVTTSLTVNGTILQTSSSASALVIGPNGATNPTFSVVTNTSSGANGIVITNTAAGSRPTIGANSSATDEGITILNKGAAFTVVRSQSADTASPSTHPIMLLQQLDNTNNNWSPLGFRNQNGTINAMISVKNENHSSSATSSMYFYTYNAGTGTVALTLSNAQAATFASSVLIPAITNVATTSAVCVNTGTGLLSYDGTLGTCTVSDGRLKNIDGPITGALDKLLKIKGVYFHWKDKKMGTDRQAGVIAQDVEKVFPELVATDSKGTKSADYQRLTAPIIEALRELKADNDNLRMRLEKLELKRK